MTDAVPSATALDAWADGILRRAVELVPAADRVDDAAVAAGRADDTQVGVGHHHTFLLIGGPLHRAVSDAAASPDVWPLPSDAAPEDVVALAAVRTWAITARWLALLLASPEVRKEEEENGSGCGGASVDGGTRDNDATLSSGNTLAQIVNVCVLSDMEWYRHGGGDIGALSGRQPLRRNCIALPPPAATTTRAAVALRGKLQKSSTAASQPRHAWHVHPQIPGVVEGEQANARNCQHPAGCASPMDVDHNELPNRWGTVCACASCMDVLALDLASRISALVSAVMRGAARKRLRFGDDVSNELPPPSDSSPSSHQREGSSRMRNRNDGLSSEMAECLAAVADACRGTTMRDGNACRYGRQWCQPAVTSFVFRRQSRGSVTVVDDAAAASVDPPDCMPSTATEATRPLPAWSLRHVVDNVNALVYTFGAPTDTASHDMT